MKNPFKKDKPEGESAFVFDGVSIMLKNASDTGINMEEVDVVELTDESGESMLFEVLATVAYLGEKYFITIVYLEDEPEQSGERTITEAYLLKEVFIKNESMLEPVSDIALVNKIFDAFRKAAGDKFDYL